MPFYLKVKIIHNCYSNSFSFIYIRVKIQDIRQNPLSGGAPTKNISIHFSRKKIHVCILRTKLACTVLKIVACMI